MKRAGLNKTHLLTTGKSVSVAWSLEILLCRGEPKASNRLAPPLYLNNFSEELLIKNKLTDYAFWLSIEKQPDHEKLLEIITGLKDSFG